MVTSVLATHPLLFGVNWMDPNWLLAHFGGQFFWVSVVIVFIECGLLFPILPGDTLLFAIGLFIAGDKIHLVPGGKVVQLVFAIVVLTAAALLGNISGYEIGRRAGPPIYERNGRIVKRRYFDQANEFFERRGALALILGRFVPVVRTFVTVVAGASGMRRHRFLVASFVGAVAWVLLVTLLGFFLGTAFPSLGQQLDKAVVVIVLISLVPVLIEWRRHRRRNAAKPGV